MRRTCLFITRVCAAALMFIAVAAVAADKSGVSPNSISLPKGPGSIEGLGQSFQPTLNTGTAKYGVGVKLPNGVAGHEPDLDFSYDGGGANGPLGFGWSISLPCIQRRTDEGIPTYGEAVGFARTDVFINEAKEELVPQANGFFFCKNEGAFIRYRQVSNHWEATLPDGTKLQFGITAAGRIEDGGRIFSWMLERETDTHGNVIEYVYRSFPGEQNLNQKYLVSVRYGPGAPPWTHFHFAALHYEDRADWFEDGRAGFLVRTGKRLKSIAVGSQGVALTGHLTGDFSGDGTTDYLNRRYDLTYLAYAGTNSHWSLLEKVTLVGADGTTALPPVTFDYTVCNPPAQLSAQGHILSGRNEPFALMDNPFVDLLDLNADGLPDILRTEPGGAHTASINRGLVEQSNAKTIQWSDAVAVDPGNGTAWNFDLGSDRTHLADMDGDGLADLVHKSASDEVFFFANRGQLGWSARRQMSVQNSTPPAPFGQSDVRTADIDFDKRTDIIQSLDVGGATAYRVWFNLGEQTYSPAVTVEPAAAFDFALSGVEIADCNGDRVPDIARVQPNAVVAIAGLGYGRFAALRTIAIPDETLSDDQIARAKLTDINGDGLSDLVLERALPGTCWYWLNLGNYTFSARKTIVDLPIAVSQNAATRWADLNGNGSIDLVYADSQATPRLQVVELGELLTGGVALNALMRIDNGIGRTIQIEYAPSTRFALEDAAAGNAWPDPLPFPVTVVAAVSVSDSLGHEYRTEFRYHDGYYDQAEKQFRGFARVEQIDVGDPSAPTLVTRSHFDTGRDFEAMKGKLLRLTAEQTNGQAFWNEVTAWATPPRILMVGTNGEPVRFAHPTGSTRDVLELGQGEPRRLETEVEFDNFGNQIRSANYGIVEGTNRAAFNDERITITEYAINTNAWIIHLPKGQQVADENGAVISRSESFYDDETFSGNNLGSVTIGNLTMQRAWINPSNAAAFIKVSRTKFDAYGNAITVFDPLSDGTGNTNQGHFRTLTFDNEFHSYPTLETIHVGNGKPALTIDAAYDQGLGTVTSSIDFNGHVTRYGYDALGRVTHFIKPGDTLEYPTLEYTYALGVSVGATGIVNYVETRVRDKAEVLNPKSEMYLITRQYSDGLGRALMNRSEAEPEPGSSAPRVVVNGAVLFNARQQPVRAFNPHFSTRGGGLEELLAFEDIEAEGWRGLFHDNGGLISADVVSALASTTEYDATLRSIRTINPDGTAARTEYKPLVTRSFDENDTDAASPHFNTPMAHVADGLGRLIRVDEMVRLNDDGTPANLLNTWTTRYEYDLNDALTRITDSQNNVKVMRYDGLERRIFMNDPDAGISTRVYDDASNLIETIDAKGQRITYTYDGANRLLTEDYHDENATEFSYHRSPDVSYVYDQPAASVDMGDGSHAAAQNTKGQLAYVDDASGQEHNSFDARGRMQWTVKRIPDPQLDSELTAQPSTLISYKTAFTYDAMDRVARLSYPDNDEVRYEYNERGLMRRIIGGPNGNILSNFVYAPSGQQQQLDFGNGVRTRYDYDTRQRLKHVRSVSGALTLNQSLVDFAYAFDGVSNIKAILDQRPTSLVPAADRRRNTQTFAYDDLYRLTRVRYNLANPPSANGGEINYRYDRIGNMISQTSDIAHHEKGRSVTDLGAMTYGGAAGSANRIGRAPNDPPGPHALSSIQHATNGSRTFPYDANGNMTEIDGLRCTWDFKDRLVAVEDGTMRAEYRYDFTDRRVLKRVWDKPATNAAPARASQSVAVIYPGKHFEVREHDAPTKYVFNGDDRVAHITGSLSSNARIQRIRLHAGWNLCSLAVAGSHIASDAVAAVHKWNQTGQNWVQISTNQPLDAGSVLWLRASANRTLALLGAYADPTNQFVAAGNSFLSSAGLECRQRSAAEAGAALASFDSLGQFWQLREPVLAFADAGFPKVAAPGRAMFINSQSPAELEVPEPALRIRYYHEDHLGSASVMTDASGALVEETAFYPFGVPRHEHRLRDIEENYKFTGKERDRESGLHYFEARFLASSIARFISIDPKYAGLDGVSADELSSFLSRPQAMNLYGYGYNNPLRYTDPSGLDSLDKPAKTSDTVGVIGGAVEEGVMIAMYKGANPSKLIGAGAGVASKGTAGISVGIAAYRFARDRNSAAGGQLLNESAKALTGLVLPPVGLIWSILDLTGYGPSAILEATEKSIKANREATKAYKKATAAYKETARIYNEALPKLEAQQKHLAERVGVLEKEANKWQQKSLKALKGDTRSLAELKAAGARQERINRRLAAQVKYWEDRARKAQQ